MNAPIRGAMLSANWKGEMDDDTERRFFESLGRFLHEFEGMSSRLRQLLEFTMCLPTWRARNRSKIVTAFLAESRIREVQNFIKEHVSEIVADPVSQELLRKLLQRIDWLNQFRNHLVHSIRGVSLDELGEGPPGIALIKPKKRAKGGTWAQFDAHQIDDLRMEAINAYCALEPYLEAVAGLTDENDDRDSDLPVTEVVSVPADVKDWLRSPSPLPQYRDYIKNGGIKT